MSKQNDTGYPGWQYLELDEQEQSGAALAQKLFHHGLKEGGVPEDVISRLKLEFDKATLNISADDASSGAFHNLAGGAPFYRMRLTAEGASMANPDDKALAAIFMMVQVFNGSLVMSNPPHITHDFKEPLDAKALSLCAAARAVAPYVNNPAGPQ